ncbi:MAG: mechanosensitive ion channel family protein [Pseudonocardiaceae bacterium]
MSTVIAQIDVGSSLRDGLSTVATFVPKIVLFLVILLIGWIIARVLRSIINKVLEKVGFERFVERAGVNRALANSRYTAGGLIAGLVYYAILLIALQIAFGAFGGNPFSTLLAGIVSFLPKAIVAVILVVIAAAIAQVVKDIIANSLSGLNYGRLLANLVAAFIIGLGVIAALNQIQVAVTVTVPILITVLATIGGVIVVGVGGGLVRPMQQRWERWLTQAEAEAPQAKAHAAAYQRGREDAGRHAEGPPPVPDSPADLPTTGQPPAQQQ